MSYSKSFQAGEALPQHVYRYEQFRMHHSRSAAHLAKGGNLLCGKLIPELTGYYLRLETPALKAPLKVCRRCLAVAKALETK